MSRESINVFWFRRDLRLEDNRGLSEALQGSLPVLPIFIFDQNILKGLPPDDARVTFIFDRLMAMRKILKEEYGSSLAMFHGTPESVFSELLEDFEIEAVFANHDYEPYAEKRDDQVNELFEEEYIEFRTFKDQVIFERKDIVKEDGDPYLVYTPYMKKWKSSLKDKDLKQQEIARFGDNFHKIDHVPELTLKEIGFKTSSIKVPEYDISKSLIANYGEERDYPSKDATSHLGPHLRFGTISIRLLCQKAMDERDETFLEELIWREFFMQLLWHFPKTVNDSFKKKYDRIEWRNNEEEFKAWCEGRTGYPLVDAGMRQLNETGYMHNRIRMVTGSFLCKHLLIDWRWGEAYFAEKLLDYDMSSNIGNWQWVAGCGADAAPYFRIFNPTTQITKFDKDHQYIKTWVKDLNELTYPDPIVDHKTARERCLEEYGKVNE
ncbi:cryptochrome/photolyase family protein [Robertkochia solimangrovi]|uniref:cryptochrome/photolyase family protein n=1 Tax=Robertkochia solimangrovi TaxID=2213046 RepID=UPI00117D4128|nr:deoxyribodipyrimidine photo-lyase [Robertkochia solimangrovi]TRZ43479.1 deoxyribodipyrimidine photo-lyase [Robertkochia solimangrovi]